ncbi:putative JmjC domain-containing histone demethylation protein 2C [Apophysomyces sp. BC1034]|nr:putative JmjC domain-containing histone demethylation protein 2C [Apophysomyces sp. BC1015]KAG0170961.1 putative JmjC domain-containing histone demethylation protein 2C [Apophysomyces sp. BC1021]KAG0184827.1 putative JmjC domain-containing histone demethylation protein 2C [Apophysomyces sp. BC1034]
MKRKASETPKNPRGRSSSGPGKRGPRQVSEDTVERNLLHIPVDLKIQDKRCNTTAYKKFKNRCKPCTNRLKGKYCHFKDLRAFGVGQNKQLTFGPYFVNTETEDPVEIYNSKQRQDIKCVMKRSQQQRTYVLQQIRQAILRILAEESRTEEENPMTAGCRRVPVRDMGHCCNACSHVIFNSYWMCAVCGVDLCHTCYRREEWESPQDTCSFRRIHKPKHMVPLTKLTHESVQRIESACREIEDDNRAAKRQRTTPAPPPEKDPMEPIIVRPSDKMSLESFQRYWKKIQPILIKSILSESLQKEISESMASDGQIKLDLDTVHRIYGSAIGQLPIKHYCIGNAYYNLANRLPKDYTRPDLGPSVVKPSEEELEGNYYPINMCVSPLDRIYSLWYADEKTDEVTDEENDEENEEGTDEEIDELDEENDAVAVEWHIYTYEDLDDIRNYLQDNVAHKDYEDVLFTNEVYLEKEDRESLCKTKKISSWCIQQKQGEALLIPAGCAFQAQIHKKAVLCEQKFLSPEHVNQSVDVTQKFVDAGYGDDIQLRQTMIFAWTHAYGDTC